MWHAIQCGRFILTRVGSKVSILQIIAVLGIIISACAAPAQSGASPTPGAAKQGGELKALLIVDSAGGFDPATMTEQTS
ncbi:MAG: hypothetical protein QOH08_533, partial [Chloroflexota bacterium]|nr:hypothetical protein [Chloroflexota bacterium]